MDLRNPKKIHFIGVAGTGMSAIAQYLAGTKHTISGSDREFGKESAGTVQRQLTEAGIQCYPQDGSGIHGGLDAVVVSTAIEDTVPEFKKAREMGIAVLHRADMLNAITDTQKTIAVAGTSGKSTTAAMLFQILSVSGLAPSIISGAGLVGLQRQGKIGNAKVGIGEWLVIEADESDGTLVKYHPTMGIILNLDKDHKEMDELRDIFSTFKQNVTETLIVNASHTGAAAFSQSAANDFGYDEGVGYRMEHFMNGPNSIHFTLNGVRFMIPVLGKHNMENAAAACAAAGAIGLPLAYCAEALRHYEGIYRRMQLLAIAKGVAIYDDYAHNPVKVAAAIRAVQSQAQRVIAWFQPHGYGPTRFLRNDFVQAISEVLRPQDQIWMSEIFYAGGTATKDISANDLIQEIAQKGQQAFFVADRNQLPEALRPFLKMGDILLLMGARDPSLEEFAKYVVKELKG
jgi:UDP-N-acetylmuramate--alanine ligase